MLSDPTNRAAPSGGSGGGAGAWGDDDLELDDDDLDLGNEQNAANGLEGGDDFFAAPSAGPSAASSWVNNSSHASDHIAAGSFETAMQLLNRQLAVVNFEPLKAQFVGVFCGAYTAVPGFALSPSLMMPLQRTPPSEKSLPSICRKLPWLIETLKIAYKYFTSGSFKESLEAFKTIIHGIPLVVTATRSETNEIKELLDIAREYITAIRMKLAITEVGSSDPVRQVELCAYFTHCALQPGHLFLALRQAMISSFKIKNFITAATFAHRLLELPDISSDKHSDMKQKVRALFSLDDHEEFR